MQTLQDRIAAEMDGQRRQDLCDLNARIHETQNAIDEMSKIVQTATDIRDGLIVERAALLQDIDRAEDLAAEDLAAGDLAAGDLAAGDQTTPADDSQLIPEEEFIQGFIRIERVGRRAPRDQASDLRQLVADSSQTL